MPAGAQDTAGGEPGQSRVIAVLSADMAPYREALSGLRKELGTEIPVFILPSRLPKLTTRTQVVVAFGQKALQIDYPESVAVVNALAPGLNNRDHLRKAGISVHISMTPPADRIISKLAALQPGLKSLGVLWAEESLDFSVPALTAAAEKAGISLHAFRAAGPDDVPDTLRSINTRLDAMWLPLDPALLTAQSFGVIKEYSLGNNLPLYVPTEKLVSSGATASVSASFADIGRTAAGAVKTILAMEKTAGILYPPEAKTGLNLVSSERIGLKFTGQIMNEAEIIVR